MFIRLTREAENGDHGEGQQHADRVGDDEAGGPDGEGEVEVRGRREHAASANTIPKATSDAERGADQGGDEVVGGPSYTNICTRWPRRVPTARATPSSLRRSAASMTKIRKISRIPAAIENEPKVVKKETNAAPAASAAVSASCLVLSVSSPSGRAVGCSASTTFRSPPTPRPVGDETPSTSPGLPSSACAAPSGISTP